MNIRYVGSSLETSNKNATNANLKPKVAYRPNIRGYLIVTAMKCLGQSVISAAAVLSSERPPITPNPGSLLIAILPIAARQRLVIFWRSTHVNELFLIQGLRLVWGRRDVDISTRRKT